MTLSPESSQTQFIREQKRFQRAIQKKIKRIQKGLETKTAELEKSKRHQEFEHVADILKSHFHLLKPRMESITVEDWAQENSLITIQLDPTTTPEEQIKNAYKQVKKLRRAQEPLQKAIVHLHEELQKWKNCLLLSTQCTTELELTTLETKYSVAQPVQSRQRTQITNTSNKDAPHRFYSATGLSILVGKNSIQNTHLTFQIARSTDLWLHAHHIAGSHVVIQKKNPKTPIDQEALLDAANLALYFSKARSTLYQAQEVLVAERRYVHRMKGAAPGKVSVSQHKIIKITLDPKRIEAIKNRFRCSSTLNF